MVSHFVDWLDAASCAATFRTAVVTFSNVTSFSSSAMAIGGTFTKKEFRPSKPISRVLGGQNGPQGPFEDQEGPNSGRQALSAWCCLRRDFSGSLHFVQLEQTGVWRLRKPFACGPMQGPLFDILRGWQELDIERAVSKVRSTKIIKGREIRRARPCSAAHLGTTQSSSTLTRLFR